MSRRPAAVFPLKTLTAACLAALPLWAQAAAGDAADGDGQAAQRVVITGSNIRRMAAETPSPVQTLSADDLKQSGYTSVADVMRNISANNMGALSQGNASAFGVGGSGVSLRGLTVGATLVLINGHRMAPYPMPDDGERDFVDMASIPFEAIERIEVLKDGASAVYGSDAIAGVVNVILKKSYVGTALSADAGVSTKKDGQSVHLSLAHGIGDLDADGYNAYGALEYKHQDPIQVGSRPYLAITDWTRWGGADLSSLSSPDYQLVPKTQSLNALGRLTKRLGDDWEFNLQASVFDSQATQVGVFNAFSVADDATVSIPTLKWGPANYLNPVVGTVGPISVPAGYAGGLLTLADFGPQTSSTDTVTTRLVAELSGTWGDWNVEGSLGWTRAETRLRMLNFVNAPLFAAAVADGSYVIPASTPANPYARLAGVSAATYAALAPAASSTSTSELAFASLHGSRELFKLAGGALSFGAGLDFIHKSMDEQYPDSFAAGDQNTPFYAFAKGGQDIAAAYAELVAPLLKSLEVDAAARLDHYNTYGRSTTPKIGFKYTPARQFTLRGTYAQGFRAPNPAETGVSGSSSGKLAYVNDPLTGQPASFPQLQLSNADLKPEKSESFTLGVIVEPSEVMNFSLDYYDITIRNQITSPGLLGNSQVAGAYDPADPTRNPIDNPYLARLYRNADGSIAYETYKFVNGSKTRTNGVDLDLRFAFKLPDGSRLKTDLSFTHVIRYDATYFGTTYVLAGTHGPGFVSGDTGSPRDRASLATTWKTGPLELTGTINYTSGMSVLDPSYGIETCDDALPATFPNGVGAAAQGFCRVASFTTFNLTGSYALTPRLTVHASVINLFDRRAPYDLQTFGTAGNGAQYGGAPYNPALHQDGAIGRYLNLGASYRF